MNYNMATIEILSFFLFKISHLIDTIMGCMLNTTTCGNPIKQLLQIFLELEAKLWSYIIFSLARHIIIMWLYSLTQIH